LSQGAINDFVNRASLYFRIEQNEKFRVAVNRYLTTYSRSGVSGIMGSLKNDLKGRQDILILINRASANRQTLVSTLTAMNVQPKYVEEIADYIFPNKEIDKPAIAIMDSLTVEEVSVKEEPLKPIDWIAPSKKFFDGIKTFCDSLGKSYYTVTIMRSNILLIKYPGQPSNENKSTAIAKTKAIINGEHIVTSRNYPTNFKYENDMLFEKDPDADGWIKYVPCP
jgi:hypothetical protein